MLPVKNFYGELNGKTIYDFTRNLDYKLSLEERLKLVMNRLYPNGKLDDYFVDLYIQNFEEGTGTNISPIKLIVNCSDSLYSDTNVARELSRIADYLLFAYEKENPNNKDYVDYVILSEQEYDKKLREEKDFVELTQAKNQMIFIKDVSKNFKKEIKQKILPSDLDTEDYCGEVLKDYQCIINRLGHELRRYEYLLSIKEKTNHFQNLGKLTIEELQQIYAYDLELSDEALIQMKYKVSRYRNILKDLRLDQLMAKNQLKGTIYFKQPLADTTQVDYGQFDFFDRQHVRELLQVQKGENFDNDLGCLIYDLNKLLKMCYFTDSERLILHMWRIEKQTQADIAKKLGITPQTVDGTINRIINKIIDKYEEVYENWYYLNIVKGKYKKCGVCGEIKLTNKFGLDSRNKDGYQNCCKNCDNARKKKNNSSITGK